MTADDFVFGVSVLFIYVFAKMNLTLFIIRGNIRDQMMELIKNNGFTLGERLTLLDGNTLLCRYCSGRLFWSVGLIDFRPLGFNQINHKIACVRCSRETYYDVKELEKHDVNFVELWAEP